MWGALIYAVLGTWLTHLIGRPLVDLNFQQQRFEADFRFNLVRARENSEQIALLHGEPAERERLTERFSAGWSSNCLQIMSRTKKLTAFTTSYSQAAVIFPYVLVAPAYFAQKIQLGGMMQTASAFGSVQEALSFFVTVYRTLAEWQAVVARLAGFEASIEAVEASGGAAGSDQGWRGRSRRDRLRAALSVDLPDRTPLLPSTASSLRADQSTLITGPSGAGKSTLFRAIAGIWPFGTGESRCQRARR